MAAIKRTFIYCDGSSDCWYGRPGEAATELDMETASEAREWLAKNEGWINRGKIDICPECQGLGYAL